MMFCYQCEQADRSGPIPGCSLTRGTCGKDEPTSALQDLLIYQLKGVADYAAHARRLGAGDDEAAGFLALAMFTTLTNVNFSQTRFVELIRQAELYRPTSRPVTSRPPPTPASPPRPSPVPRPSSRRRPPTGSSSRPPPTASWPVWSRWAPTSSACGP